jgi:hypothetical protein
MTPRAASRIVAGILALAGTACVSHPVGPARTYATYEGKAATTAEGALSQVETVRLAAKAAGDDKGFGPYVAQVVADAEDGVSTVEGTFTSIQPPDHRADELRKELDDLLSDALDHVVAVRIAARQGRSADLARVTRPLEEDARKLRRFLEAHQ